MVDYNLINSLDVNEDSFEKELAEMMGGQTTDEALATTIDTTLGNFQTGAILKGRVVGLVGGDVVVDVGLKSEGVVPASEWDDPSSIDVGDEVDVWLETVE